MFYNFRRFRSEKELVRQLVLELVSKNLVKPVGGAGMPAGMPGKLISGNTRTYLKHFIIADDIAVKEVLGGT